MTTDPHPQARALLEDAGTAWTPPDVDADRRADRAAAAAEPRPEIELVEDVDAGGVPCRLYRPTAGAPVALYVHGGGWVFHDLETHDAFCRHLAGVTGWALLAVDYRRAPEHPYPAPLDDVEAAARWLRTAGERLGVDTSVLVGIGDSAGGNLVAGLTVRDAAILDAQLLIYPVTDAAAPLDGTDAAAMAWYWDAYAPGDLRHRPDVSVARADLARLPRALVVTAEHDVLAAQGEEYAAALAEAGVQVTGLRTIGMVHGFWRFPALVDASRDLVPMVGGWLASVRGADPSQGLRD